MLEAFKNEQGQSVYPAEAVAFVDDAHAVFDTEAYEKLKNPYPTDAQDSPAPESGAGEPAPVTPEPQLPDFDSLVKEKSGGKFEKWDDVLSRITETEKPVELPENTKKILEALQKGEEDPIADYLLQKRLLSNVDKLSNEDKIKLKIQMENPDFSPEDVKDEFELQYGLDADEDEVGAEKFEKLKRKHERDLLKAARGADEFFQEAKNGLSLPNIKVDDKTEYYAALESEQKEFGALNEKLMASLDKDISSFKEIDMSYTDKDVQFTHKFEITEEERKSTAEELRNFWETFKSSYYKDDQWQVNDMMRHQYVKNNFLKLIKSAVSKASTSARIEEVKGIANVVPDKPAAPSLNLQQEAERKAVSDFILA